VGAVIRVADGVVIRVASGIVIKVASGVVIKLADGAVIGTTSGIVVGIASRISRVAGGKARDACVASKGLLRSVDAGGTIASLSKVKLSQSCKATVIIGLILIRAKPISLSVYL